MGAFENMIFNYILDGLSKSCFRIYYGTWTVIVHTGIFGQTHNRIWWIIGGRCFTCETSTADISPYSIGCFTKIKICFSVTCWPILKNPILSYNVGAFETLICNYILGGFTKPWCRLYYGPCTVIVRTIIFGHTPNQIWWNIGPQCFKIFGWASDQNQYWFSR